MTSQRNGLVYRGQVANVHRRVCLADSTCTYKNWHATFFTMCSCTSWMLLVDKRARELRYSAG